MEIHSTIDALRTDLDAERAAGRTIGFVPTMGALHDGHRSLMQRSVSECDRSVLSIFVNPLQFGPNEDLDKYPRSLNADSALAANTGIDFLFVPDVDEMYPKGTSRTTVSAGDIGNILEGLSRPGHFDGVATVVAKLFAIAGTCRAYFGEKDWQQLAVVHQLTADLSLPVEVVGCPIVRDSDGLALSSRNAYLDDAGRASALALSAALRTGVELIGNGTRSPLAVIAAMTDVMADQPGLQAEYAAVVDGDFRVPSTISGAVRLLVAARVGSARLIDNMGAFV